MNFRRVSPNGNASDVLQLEKTPVAYFDLEGSALVTVTLPEKVASAVVTPRSSGINATVSGNRVEFTVSKAGQYTVEFNDSVHKALHLFVNPIESNPPAQGSDNLLYYGPGIHEVHWIMLDLGSQKEFNKIVLKHASNTTINKDFPTYNTRQMTLEYSNDKTNWSEFLTIQNGDQKPVNTRYFDKITARYIRLNIQISGTIDTDARIAEIEVYNSSETPVKEEDVPLNATTTATVSSSSTAPAQTSPSSVSGTSSSAPVSPVLLIIVVLVVVIFVAVAVVCAVWVLKKTGSNN